MKTTNQLEINGTIARELIQCKDENGRIGNFLKTNGGRQVSPTFDNLPSLYTWARQNGWSHESGAFIYQS